jgi:hypothetical protein
VGTDAQQNEATRISFGYKCFHHGARPLFLGSTSIYATREVMISKIIYSKMKL